MVRIDTACTIPLDGKLPKYKQFAGLFSKYIDEGKLKNGDRLPSIVDCSLTYGLSRDTIFKAYKELHSKGYITSVNKRGYYVSHLSERQPCKKVFFSSGSLTGLNLGFYQNLWGHLETNAYQCTYVNHQNDIDVLKSHLELAIGNHHVYVIEPQLLPHEMLEQLFKDKMNYSDIIILNDQEHRYTAAIKQISFNVDKGLELALKTIHALIAKYETLNLVLQTEDYFPYKLIKGFFKYCDDHGLEGNIIEQVDAIEKNNGYLNLNERSLFKLLKLAKDAKLDLGKDVGIITLFEKPYLDFLNGGITALSWYEDELSDLIISGIQNTLNEFALVIPSLFVRNSF